MKTLKTISQANFVKKIEKLVENKEVKKSTHVHNLLIQASNGWKDLRTVWSTGGSWKYSKLNDFTTDVTRQLDKIGIAYEIRNDAPKGGKTGKHIFILTKVKKSW
jgi:hypothetical protein